MVFVFVFSKRLVMKKVFFSLSSFRLPKSKKILRNWRRHRRMLKPSCVDAGVSYEDRVARRKEEIASLQETLEILNGKVEHDDYKATYAANTAAVDLLKFAKNRFKKFYNPKMQKLSAKRELSDDEQMTLNTGGSLKKLGAK